MTLNSAWSVFLDVLPRAGAVEAGRQAAFELASGNSTLRRIAGRLLTEDDPTGEALRGARSVWSSLDEIHEETDR